MKFIYFTVLLLSFNSYSFGELTSEQNNSLVLIKQEISLIEDFFMHVFRLEPFL